MTTNKNEVQEDLMAEAVNIIGQTMMGEDLYQIIEELIVNAYGPTVVLFDAEDEEAESRYYQVRCLIENKVLARVIDHLYYPAHL